MSVVIPLLFGFVLLSILPETKSRRIYLVMGVLIVAYIVYAYIHG